MPPRTATVTDPWGWSVSVASCAARIGRWRAAQVADDRHSAAEYLTFVQVKGGGGGI